MSITREDIMKIGRMEPKEKQLELFEYWGEELHDPRLNTPMDMVSEFCTKTGQVPDPALYAGLVGEEYAEWIYERAISCNLNQEKELKELADLVYVIYGYALSKNWNLDEAVRRVHENNLGRCVQPDGTIRRRSDGKIEKNKDYPKVELGDLV